MNMLAFFDVIYSGASFYLQINVSCSFSKVLTIKHLNATHLFEIKKGTTKKVKNDFAHHMKLI